MSLVNATTTPRLLRLVESGMLDVSSLVTHRMFLSLFFFFLCSPISAPVNLALDFPCDQAPRAYETFQAAAQHQALKVAIDFST